ncbi:MULTISPECIES: hypothetical protein [Blastomonas]|jgi:hypothetical protein|uniref:hypothetical protein n=1 Tax=Blastomonas TaxID=150203 RepID=UPI0006B9A592|nr:MULTISPECIES: hypothetical protein [Blastomonas]KPF76163.1 hypothetical protein IP68_06755 [Blastomonas sp. AAP25]MDM7927260.1 hypothetical protein [Blastomonas fulva]MDM7966377.1 hypothetical protein [Blastomonas fulva]
MTCDPHANLHLGLSAEAMVLIDPQLGDRPTPGANKKGLLPLLMAAIALLMLLPGGPSVQKSGFRQLARAMECASPCNEPPMIAARAPMVSH